MQHQFYSHTRYQVIQAFTALPTIYGTHIELLQQCEAVAPEMLSLPMPSEKVCSQNTQMNWTLELKICRFMQSRHKLEDCR